MIQSPLTRGRGLKRIVIGTNQTVNMVAPHAGAWIETPDRAIKSIANECRPSRGGVD